MHYLTPSKVKFQASPQADVAFRRLRQSFTSVPVLNLPDSGQQFIVDASGVGIYI